MQTPGLAPVLTPSDDHSARHQKLEPATASSHVCRYARTPTLKAFLKERVCRATASPEEPALGVRSGPPAAAGQRGTSRSDGAAHAESGEKAKAVLSCGQRRGDEARRPRSGTGAGPRGSRVCPTEWRGRGLGVLTLKQDVAAPAGGRLLPGDCRTVPWRGMRGSGSMQSRTRCAALAGRACATSGELKTWPLRPTGPPLRRHSGRLRIVWGAVLWGCGTNGGSTEVPAFPLAEILNALTKLNIWVHELASSSPFLECSKTLLGPMQINNVNYRSTGKWMAILTNVS